MTPASASPASETIELRLADVRDMHAMRRVADRDTRSLPPGPHLVAIREGRLDAALSLATGQAVADPFRRTAELVELLRCHARAMPALADDRATPRPRVRLRPRPVTA